VALGTAVGLAQATGAALKLVDVAVPMPLYVYAGYEYGGITDFDPAWDEEALASARTYVDGIVARLRGAGITVDGDARMVPDVADAIVTFAENASADVIVMSTRARQMRRVCTPPQVLRPASETCGLPISAVGVTLAVDDEDIPVVGAGGEPREN
jgi:nucleotide-binding universal stress UspA family protein